ncbi:MAG: HAD family phosphatase [Lachnospiraceae bacterium]|nr:HAD family phosphatase [Lachnospiraceae bacterium]
MKDFDAVIFDMDGVIFDSETCVIESWMHVADKYNIEGIEEACNECLGLNREATKIKMLERYGSNFPYDEFKQEASKFYHDKYDGGLLPLKPGIEDLLRFLKDNDKKVAVASSTRREVVEAEIRDAGLLKYFDILVCGDMVAKSKPEPEIFLKACELLEVSPSRSFGIEDSYNGIRSASSAGLRTIMVPDRMEPDDEMRNLSEVILPSLVEVKEYMGE